MVSGSARHSGVLSSSDGNLISAEGRLLVQYQDDNDPKLIPSRIWMNNSENRVISPLDSSNGLRTPSLSDNANIITHTTNDSTRIMIQTGPTIAGNFNNIR